MNEPDAAPGQRRRPAPLLIALAGAAVPLGACSSPFSTTDADRGLRIAPERLRQVERLGIDRYADPERAERDRDRIAQGASEEAELPDFFEGVERLELTLEDCRAWALENNLALRARLVDPLIAAETQSEQEAAFEAVFTLDGRWSEFDQPTDSQLEGSQFSFQTITPGVVVPLRTGGTLSVNLPVTRSETDNQFATLNPSWESDIAFSFSQPLLRNAGRRASTQGIRLAALETQISEARTKLEVIRQVAEADRAYWVLYALRSLLDVRIQQYELALEQLRQAERRVRAGDAPDVEVVRAQSGLADRIDGIIRSLNDLRQAQRGLKRIINVPGLDVGGETLLVPSTPPAPAPYTFDARALAGAAIVNRMEMLELELRIAQDFSTIEFERNQALPNFLLDFNYSYNGLGGTFSSSVDGFLESRFADWSAGFRLEVPIGNEAAESRVHRAILTRLQRLATKEDREQSIRREVFDSVDEINAAWQRILAAGQAVTLAARTLEAEQNQFRVGARTSTDVLDAATRLADAQAAEISALTDYQIAQVDLAFATGTLLGAARVDWEPFDPRSREDYFGDELGDEARDWLEDYERRNPVELEPGTPPIEAPSEAEAG